MVPPFARTVTAYVSAASANAITGDQRGGSAAAAISRRTMKDRNATANGTSGPTSESAGRKLAAATMPVATSASDTRTSVLPDICRPSLPAGGSGPASVQAEDERGDRGRLCRERDHKDDADHARRVGDDGLEQADLDEDRDREEDADAHLASADEVVDPQAQERVRQRGDAVRADERGGRGVLRSDDDADDEHGRQEVGDRHQSARREDERERQAEGAVRVLPAGVRARGALEEQVTDRDRREQHD